MDGKKLTPLEKRRQMEQGQSLVEFAATAIILLLILSGLLDLGRIWFTYVTVEDAAGEAAAFLSVFPSCGMESTACPDGNNAPDRAMNSSNYSGCTDMEMYIQIPPRPEIITNTEGLLNVGDSVLVTVECRMQLITPIIQNIAGADGLVLSASAAQRIVSEKYITD